MKLSLFALVVLAAASASAADSIPPIPRVLPPEGLEIPAEVRSQLETRLAATKKRLEGVNTFLRSDVEIFTKAVEFALLHREFYVEKDFTKADWALDEADKRLDSLDKGESPWTKATGLVVEGYRSFIDGSTQPYGLVIPEGHDFEKPCPLYVWLHGRGDKNTDLHFLYERASRPGQIAPPGAIVVHPFGRHCVGWKHAGEIDVLNVAATVSQRYKIDRDRVVLIGFSMGGAGAWHIGAHHPPWLAVSPGAGFAETARYQRLTPDRYPPPYEQTLWGLYDVPNYVRNLFNTEVIAYSGELDKQIQAARIMEEAYKNEGRTLTHLIGPAVEHKYEPNTLAELMKRLDAIVAKGREKSPREAHLQTRTLRYSFAGWVGADGLEEHWLDSRIDATRSDSKIEVQTKNIARFWVLAEDAKNPQVVIDGQALPANPSGAAAEPRNRGAASRVSFVKRGGKWDWLAAADAAESLGQLSKRPLIQGPIDDVFMHRVLVVTPTGKSKNARFQAWVDFELAHFRDRWRALMRGEPPMKNDVEFTDADANLPLVLWGDPDSNSVMARMIEKTPVGFNDGQWTFGGQTFDGDRYVPSMIYPRQETVMLRSRALELRRPTTAYRYTVLNSGLTFREGHDNTNSQQNPKLPDWAIIDLTQPPDAKAPGRIHDAGFFDEQWQLKGQPKGP